MILWCFCVSVFFNVGIADLMFSALSLIRILIRQAYGPLGAGLSSTGVLFTGAFDTLLGYQNPVSAGVALVS